MVVLHPATLLEVCDWGLTLHMANDKCLKDNSDQLRRALLYSSDIWVLSVLGGLDWRGDSISASLGLGFIVRPSLVSQGPGFQFHSFFCSEREERASLSQEPHPRLSLAV